VKGYHLGDSPYEGQPHLKRFRIQIVFIRNRFPGLTLELHVSDFDIIVRPTIGAFILMVMRALLSFLGFGAPGRQGTQTRDRDSKAVARPCTPWQQRKRAPTDATKRAGQRADLPGHLATQPRPRPREPCAPARPYGPAAAGDQRAAHKNHPQRAHRQRDEPEASATKCPPESDNNEKLSQKMIIVTI
jgi:hypothetical protein